ncbi:hypothetical protein [Pelagibacterium limicola]|uniref:hypothetical protein n=1 Tax=Pelagibacterium limicola TaxID=2791022 RepID=UPI0018AF8DF6|nr:hypothetical protein [Pelagibacterium limicola]
MRKTGILMGSAVVAFALLASWPALSQSIDFGDDTSRWANDGQCDDPRFEGTGAAAVRIAADEGRDATDCRTAFEAGTVTLVTDAPEHQAEVSEAPEEGEIDFGDDSGTWANDGECDDPRFGGGLESHRRADATDCRSAYEADSSIYIGESDVSDTGDIDFGDDSGTWANDGECDDPRFGGGLESHRFADATDCRAAYEDDPSIYIGEGGSNGDIDFGNDSGSWANDGECDDPRFGGGLESHRRADATDCRAAYEADPSIYIGESDVSDTGDIDFGDDSGTWANDGECDDPRFGGGLESHRLADATDCRAAYEADPSIYIGESETSDIDGIDFGDDSGAWASDGECDDPRFGGGLDSHRFADASDCRAAYQADPSIYLGDSGPVTGSLDFGDDSGDYTHSGVCDDPRFEGTGSASVLLFADRMADATDCETLYRAGEITFAGVRGDPAVAGVNEIDFGDDTSDYANNDKCDDPRFDGPGTDSVLLHGDRGHDASDCRALFLSGEVWLAGTSSDTTGSTSESSSFRINFGDDSGDYPHDGECDDPRFQGRGAASELFESNRMRDATDCRAAYDAGTVTYEP